ncbi:hypothetical protein DE146DRAFT_780997 [Phaeosphaeria sp. MPI-PUGE-AT-0046c]|nr:hypothetical protein DE146DRAFT_780997 [Phaeosphaeria sp. MPI-PUGE-AT-0046c]
MCASSSICTQISHQDCITTIMQFSSFLLLACGLAPAMVSGAPQGLSLRQDEPLPSASELFVTFWEKGCGTPVDPNGSKATYNVHDKGPEEPGDPAGECLQVINYGWQSVEIEQPSDVTLYSGLGCVDADKELTVSTSTCYTTGTDSETGTPKQLGSFIARRV